MQIDGDSTYIYDSNCIKLGRKNTQEGEKVPKIGEEEDTQNNLEVRGSST